MHIFEFVSSQVLYISGSNLQDCNISGVTQFGVICGGTEIQLSCCLSELIEVCRGPIKDQCCRHKAEKDGHLAKYVFDRGTSNTTLLAPWERTLAFVALINNIYLILEAGRDDLLHSAGPRHNKLDSRSPGRWSTTPKGNHFSGLVRNVHIFLMRKTVR